MIREIPDLLYEEPKMVVDDQTLQEALNEAFFLGKPKRALENALSLMDKGNQWDPESFSHDLFLKDLVETCFQFKIRNVPGEQNNQVLQMLLSHPPVDLKTIRFRQNISLDLENPETLEEVKRVYAGLQWMVSYLNDSMQGSYTSYSDVTNWRMTILRQIRTVVDLMAHSFKNTDSGLSRLRRAGLELKLSDQYSQLADLVDYDDNMLGLNLNIRVGASGELRDFRVNHVKENTENRHYSPPGRRLWDKVKLWVRGYNFSNVELVSSLIEKVFKDLEAWLTILLQVMGQLDFYLAGYAFKERAEAHGLAVCLPEFTDKPVPAKIEGLFNPLLFKQKITPVSSPVSSGCGTTTLVTGPNSGGKTRLLQALGIAQLMGQSGIYAPASSARIHPAQGMFVSLIEEGKVDQKEGRLGMELIRIRTLFEKSHPGCMILLDELCSGTNPSEGIEILDLVLSLLPKLNANTYISTHFLEYARSLHKERPMANLEFLKVDLNNREQPTYQFVQGVAGTSLARNTARRLGVTLDELLGLIEKRSQPAPQKNVSALSAALTHHKTPATLTSAVH